MKKITCHSIEDQNLATKEVEITRSLNHPNIVKVVGSSTSGTVDIVHNTTSEVYYATPSEVEEGNRSIVVPKGHEALPPDPMNNHGVYESTNKKAVDHIWYHACAPCNALK